MRRWVLGLMFGGALFGAGCGDDDFGAERFPVDLSVASDANVDQSVTGDLSVADRSAVADLARGADLAARDSSVDGGGDLAVAVDAGLVDSSHGE